MSQAYDDLSAKLDKLSADVATLAATHSAGTSDPQLQALAVKVDAVQAVVEIKTIAKQQSGKDSVWVDGAAVTNQVPAISQAAIRATTAYCEYVWNRYGRFPAYLAPFRTVVGHQACHLDAEFYDRFYRPEALTKQQREDFGRITSVRSPPDRHQ